MRQRHNYAKISLKIAIKEQRSLELHKVMSFVKCILHRNDIIDTSFIIKNCYTFVNPIYIYNSIGLCLLLKIINCNCEVKVENQRVHLH